MSHRLIPIILLFLVLPLLEARGPEDQIILPPAREKGVRILRNKNITYTNEQPDEKGGTGVVRTLHEVKGRSRPDRTGKVLSQIEASSIVTPFKLSRDKKWVAIIVRTSGVRVWVPKSTLPTLDKNLKLEKSVSTSSNKKEQED